LRDRLYDLRPMEMQGSRDLVEMCRVSFERGLYTRRCAEPAELQPDDQRLPVAAVPV